MPCRFRRTAFIGIQHYQVYRNNKHHAVFRRTAFTGVQHFQVYSNIKRRTIVVNWRTLEEKYQSNARGRINPVVFGAKGKSSKWQC